MQISPIGINRWSNEIIFPIYFIIKYIIGIDKINDIIIAFMNIYRLSYIKILFIFPLVAPKLFKIINSCFLSYKLAFKILIILII